MRGANDVAVETIAQYPGILPPHTGWHRLTHKWKGLMTIQPAQFDDVAVQREAMICKDRLAKTHTACVFIDNMTREKQPYMNGVEMRLLYIPEPHFAKM